MRVKLLLASSNAGKLREYRALVVGCADKVVIDLPPGFSEFPAFPEDAPTFAENAAGKALHYSRFANEIVFADDSGLVVESLGGAPGVRSARYAGENASDAQRNVKLLAEMREKTGDARKAKFVCVIAVAKQGKMLVVVSDSVEGTIANEPRGSNGFGYDPLFYFASHKKTFGELIEAEKNQLSHRGKAFRRFHDALISMTGPDLESPLERKL
ncbi:MAG: RdgB/HAM1 family non-canonical purine NTP pyrophosphatase [Candidatus Acidiferrales bacterium]